MDHQQFQRIAKALADPRRFEMLETIAGQPEVACQQLCREFPVSQGQFVFYRIRPGVMRDYVAELQRRVPAKRRA